MGVILGAFFGTIKDDMENRFGRVIAAIANGDYFELQAATGTRVSFAHRVVHFVYQHVMLVC